MNRLRHSTPGPSGARWRSSTYSGGNNECVEVAVNLAHLIPVRDSKRPASPVLVFSRGAWTTFVDHLR
ncbi:MULTISPECIES: DUF397 domain-containing protein [Streptomyces]|uniref:DUF397 domain-containing protein n=1 Tax=Streptomyces apricus TaxID=1828112 RepID=A0A5B0B354_9ACTN|nr:DUF397 domain-containing protein [Streptomyces apricus]KAA0935129.1 DUF397 domain-containing protein [Streptomyces apricus]